MPCPSFLVRVLFALSFFSKVILKFISKTKPELKYCVSVRKFGLAKGLKLQTEEYKYNGLELRTV